MRELGTHADYLSREHACLCPCNAASIACGSNDSSTSAGTATAACTAHTACSSTGDKEVVSGEPSPPRLSEIGKESAAEGSVDLRADGGMSYALTPPQGRAAEVCLRGMGVWVGGQEEEIAEIAECRGNMANWWRGGRVVRWLREVTVGLNVWKKASHCRTRDLEEEGTRAVAGSWEMRGGK